MANPIALRRHNSDQPEVTKPLRQPRLDRRSAVNEAYPGPFSGSKLRAPVHAQAKLSIGAPNDAFEREAEEVAERLMRADPAEPRPTTEAPRSVQRLCGDCEEEEITAGTTNTLQRTPYASGANNLPHVDATRIQRLHRGGVALPTSVRSDMERYFGRDFGAVRIHNDATAGSLARSVLSHAFTLGSDIVFAPGRFAPGTKPGRGLLAHELTHVVQQGKAPPRGLNTRSPTPFMSGERVIRRAPAESQQDTQSMDDISAMTGCSPEQLKALGAAFRHAAEVLERTIVLIRSQDDSAAPVIEFFLGKLDEMQHTTLLLTLQGVQKKILDLKPERYRCTTGASGAKFIPGLQESPGMYEFQDVVPDTVTGPARPRVPDELPSLGSLTHNVIHEATHDYLNKSLRLDGAPDFSMPHGIISILPVLAGVNALENAESIAAVASSLGMGEFSAMKLQAVRSMSAPGKPGLERKLQVSVVAYARDIYRRSVLFKSATRADGAKKRWVSDFVNEELKLGVLRRNIDWATMRRPIKPVANDGEIERLFGLMKRGYEAVGNVLTIDARRIQDTEAIGASLEKDVLRVPGTLLESIRKAAQGAGPQKIELQTFREFIKTLFSGIMYEYYNKAGDFTGMIAKPQDFWTGLARVWLEKTG